MNFKKTLGPNVSALLLLAMTAFTAFMFYVTNRALAVADNIKAENARTQGEIGN